MFGRDEVKKPGGVETILGPTVRIDGKFVGKGNVVVQGNVSGSLRTTEDLQIEDGAVVKANVDAKNVVIAGEVHGSVKAAERLELTATAKIFGDVEAKTISIGAGAILNGKCTMTDTQMVTSGIEESSQYQNGKTQKSNRRAEQSL